MSKLKVILVLAAVAAVFAFGAYAAAYVVASGRSSAVAVDASAHGAQMAYDVPDATTQIAFWSKRLAAQPDAYLDLTLLGQAFARKARETSDVTYYLRAERALRGALRVNPSHVPASASLASVLFSLHEFQGALAVARPIVGDARGVQALATLGDAYLALGEYGKAGSAYARLSKWAASPGLYARLALVSDLYGNKEQALRLMERASRLAQESGDYGESLGWYAYQLGELSFRAGRLDAAEEHYRAALASFPNHAPALAGLAKTYAARGDLRGAIRVYRRAATIVPQPDFLAALGDLYAATGQPRLARRQYSTVEVVAKLARVNRQVYNRQLAVFYADHGIHSETAARLALGELRVRKDVYGYDAAAWALARTGRCREALPLATRALRLGTEDALLFFHRGYAEGCAGNRAAMRAWFAKALDLNPAFSIRWSPVARAALENA